ncbi:hypothetical protein JG687_00002120 [Phytophthora cactorum]|uniref:Uncharacterized protein n=1 Tax=Phytophthora cactorum TaxID=29920 RepID=A0A8T1UVB1_9STRA|nr:hypothetical protein JG687_00002120 [Phytophthora cactorum]
MGKASVAQEQDVPGNGSREVFQGLFKDLGKQAMALEAILRAVCGRVDKMENWLTEVSFGMTELDLKLRNIAHNIDGTAAVDDEARGPHRWAIPQAETVKPVAPTVSKKLGTDKKVVRVTGMAAAILDQLATTSETTPIETEKAEKPSTNKKKQENIEEESQESGKDSSPDESNSSSDEEQDEDEEAAVEEISNAMTALKKLKRAQMLSPEEETELKERAHKKWFQLKGHIKEKQKKDVTNILLKRKKNVFTVSSRIELLEEKSREIFAALKHITNEMREKNDRSTHETLRRRVADIEQSLLTIDSRIASLSAPAMENVRDLENEVVSLRTTVQMQLTTAQSEATARHSLLEEALASQRALVETLAQDVPAQIDVQTELFMEKLKQLPDHTVAIENLRRSLKRKADLKLLKE